MSAIDARSLASSLLPVALQRYIRKCLVRYRHHSFTPREVLLRYGSATFRLMLVDEKGARWYGGDRDWEDEIRLLMGGRLRSGARVFDVGAHQGVVALALASIVGPAGLVVAVEPSSFDLSAAMRNKELNGCPQLKFVHAAVSSSERVLHFSLYGKVAVDPRFPSEQVRAVTLDGLAAQFGVPDVVFMDIDGHESEALAGAGALLDAGADWYVEIGPERSTPRGPTTQLVIDAFLRRGYVLFISQEVRPSKRKLERLEDVTLDRQMESHLVALWKDGACR